MNKKKLLVAALVIIMLIATVSPALADPTAIYGTKDGKTLRFVFSDLLTQYGNDNAAYKAQWEGATKTSMLVGQKTIDWSAFLNAVGNGQATNADSYAALPTAVTATAPSTVNQVDATGSVGATAVANPDAPVVTTVTITTAAGGTVTVGGATLTLAAEVKDQYGNVMTGQTVEWTSSDVTKATVANGIVTAVAAGTTNIIAKVGTVESAAYTVTVNAAQALTVSSVTAVNGTTIKVVFNRTPLATETLTYTIAGTAYIPVMNDVEATLTVSQMVDNTNYLVVVNNGTANLYNANVMYDRNEATTLTVQNTDLNATVGVPYTLEVMLVDEDGDAVANQELTLELPANGAFEAAQQMMANTDASGIASFTWTRNHVDAGELIDCYVSAKPTVRENATRIVWALAETMVTVAEKSNVTLGDGTVKEYNVTTRTAVGADYVGAVVIDFAGTGAAVDLTGVGQNMQIQIWNGNAWVNAAASAAPRTLVETDNDTATVTLAAAANGTFRFRVYNTNAALDSLTPTVWYDADASGTLNAPDPRSVGARISYVAQTPVFTLIPVTAINTIATTVVGSTTSNQKDYTLACKDQFGNQYRGVINIDTVANADGLAGTVASGTVRFNVSYAQNTTFAGAAVRFNAGAVNAINLAIGGADADENSTMTLRVTNTAAETVQPVVFTDIANPIGAADVADIYDANDGAVMPEAVVSQARVISSIAVAPETASETGAIAVGGNRIYVATFTDQFGDVITPLDLGVGLRNATTGLPAANSQIANLDLDNSATPATLETAVNAVSILTLDAAGTPITTTNNRIRIQVNAGLANDADILRVFADSNDSDTFQPDEVNGTIAVNWTGQVLTTGEITGAFQAGTIIGGAAATKGIGYDYAAQCAANDAGELTLTYTLRDQSNGVYTNGAAETHDVTWTIVNNGTTAARYNDGAWKAIAAGETVTFTTTVAAGASTTTAALEATDNATQAELTVTARIAGNDATAKSAKVLFIVPANNITADPAAAASISGTVVAFSKDGDNNGAVANNDGTRIIIKVAGVTYIAYTHAAAGLETLSIDGTNFGITEAALETNLTLGDTLGLTLSGDGAAFAANDTAALTNH